MNSKKKIMITTISKKLMQFFILILVTFNGYGQKVGDNAVQWYNWTEDDTRHYVYEMGKDNPKDETVVVIHGGWGAEHSYLIEPFEPLSEDYRFILYDQRGSLRTPAPDSTIRLERLVEDLEDLRKALDLNKITLAAHSAGNHLAYAYLTKYPKRVNDLILIAPIFPVPFGKDEQLFTEVLPEANWKKYTASSSNWRTDAMEKGRERAIKEGLMPDSLKNIPIGELNIYNIGEDKQKTLAWRIFFTAVNSCNSDNWQDMRGGYVFYDQSVANAITSTDSYSEISQDFWQAMKSFEGSVHVIIGTCDFVDIGPVMWPAVVESLKDGHINVIEGGGHNAWIADPKKFENEMRTILSNL